MKMTSAELQKCKSKLARILPVAFTLYPNGIFNALDISYDSKDKLLSDLKSSGALKNISCTHYRVDNGEDLYQLSGIVDYNLLCEDIKLNNQLNPKIWTSENDLIPEVEAKIHEIVNYFVDTLDEDGVKIKVEDIYIIGSNANFNYNESSDLDVHIIADETFDCDDRHLDIIYKAYKTLFNRKYDITINGINVEIYVENKDVLNNVSAGVYSLNDGWISNPSNYEIPDIDEVKLENLISSWEDRYLKLINAPDIKKIDEYIDDIYVLRSEGLKEGSEFSLGNLTFKEIRRLGYLDNLKDLRDKLQGEALSL